jgi:hypothetical protein
MKKIGSIFMVSVLALAGIGVSYAGFTDAVYVYGTVDTATVEIDWIGWYSGTWVWKIWEIDPVSNTTSPPGSPDEISIEFSLVDEILIYRGFEQYYPGETAIVTWAGVNGYGAEMVAFAEAGDGSYVFPDGTASDIDMVYDNLFPCIDFCADFIFHYGGSIPAKINVAEIFPILYDIMYPDSEELAALWDMYQNNPTAGFGMWVEAYRCDPVIDNATGAIIDWIIRLDQPVDVGTQLHFCDYVMVKLCIHLPQDNYWQGLNGAFGGIIEVIQWYDDCPPPPGTAN